MAITLDPTTSPYFLKVAPELPKSTLTPLLDGYFENKYLIDIDMSIYMEVQYQPSI